MSRIPRRPHRLVLPAALAVVLALVAGHYATAATRSPETFYVDAVNGDDANAGTSTSAPWQTLSKVSSASLIPGDTVAFARGQSWAGQQLKPTTSGAANAPIVYTAYGSGALPKFDGGPAVGGSLIAPILVTNHDHLRFSYLDITNSRTTSRSGVADIDAYGIEVQNTGTTDLTDFTFDYLNIHDVKSIATTSFDSNNQAGIGVFGRSSDNTISSVSIQHSTFTGGTRFGVLADHPGGAVDQTNDARLLHDVTFRYNTCTGTGGSCVNVRRTKNVLVSWDTITNSGTSGPGMIGRGSGGWIVRCVNAVIQHNTISGARGGGDSAGFHVDGANTNVLLQYNNFRDNEGYGIEILGGNYNVIYRYNLSVDDGWRQPNGGMVFADTYIPQGTAAPSNKVCIYGNTLSFDKNQNVKFTLALTNSYIYNNIFSAETGSQITPLVVESGTSGNTIENNLFHNADSTVSGIDSNPVLGSPGFVGGPRTDSNSFKLAAGSNAIKAGVSLPDPTFDALATGIFAYTPKSPTVDFYGQPLPSGTPNIGADQHQG